jgi:hypothetical protein
MKVSMRSGERPSSSGGSFKIAMFGVSSMAMPVWAPEEAVGAVRVDDAWCDDRRRAAAADAGIRDPSSRSGALPEPTTV